MAKTRLVAHYVVTAASANLQASTTNLLGVDYHQYVAAETEFPTRIGSLDVFVRFYTWNCHPVPIAVEVWQLDSAGNALGRVHHNVREVSFRPAEFVHDHSFWLHNVAIPNAGVYNVRVCRLARSRTSGVYWKVLRHDYFHVGRRS